MSISEYADITPFLRWKLDMELKGMKEFGERVMEEEAEAEEKRKEEEACVQKVKQHKAETGLEAYTRMSQKRKDTKTKMAKSEAKRMIKAKKVKKINSYFSKR
jgi:hypothetical protein